MDFKSLTDDELIHRFSTEGETAYVGELFKRYKHLVFGVCMKYLKDEEESKDAVMQIFERLFTDLKKHKVSYFKGWLYRVAKNYCLMQLRGNRHTVLREAEWEKLSADGMEYEIEIHLDGESSHEEELKWMEKGIEQLNEEQRLCIKLFYLENKCYEEVSQITGFDMNKVKSYIQNGKRNLKIYMNSKYE